MLQPLSASRLLEEKKGALRTVTGHNLATSHLSLATPTQVFFKVKMLKCITQWLVMSRRTMHNKNIIVGEKCRNCSSFLKIEARKKTLIFLFVSQIVF